MAKAEHYLHVSPTTPNEETHPGDPAIRPKDADPETESLRRWKATMRKRIGSYGLVVVIGGIPVQLGIMAFLGYLWYQQDNGDALTGAGAWRSIVLNAWMAPTITLASVVIRAIAGVHLVVCTALLAGLILETGAARFEDAARLSILRAYNSGPLDIVFLVVQRLPRLRVSFPEFIALVLLLVGIAMQFSSTLLVSDLADTVIHSDAESRRVPVVDTSGLFVQANGQYMWTKYPGVWPTFAEARAGNGSVGADISDTGTIKRALLPFGAQERLLLRSYEGLAIMQEARTMCVPADLGDTRLTLYRGTDQIALEGTVSAPLQPFHDAGFVFLNDTSGRRDNRTEMRQTVFGCPFWNYNSAQKELGVQQVDLVLAICFIGDSGFERFVIINARGGNFTTWYDLWGARFQRLTTENGWANYLPVMSGGRPTPPEHILTASVCGFKQNHSLETISASTAMTPAESPLQWDNRTGEWGARPVLRLLGAVDEPSGPEARGLLRLHSHTPSNELDEVLTEDLRYPDRTSVAMTTAFRRGTAPVRPGGFLGTYNESLIFCTRCNDAFGNSTVHPAHIILMQAALNATNNPAVALDALWATWTQQLYSNTIGQFDGAGRDNATVVWAKTVLAPQRWVGFIVTIALVVAHSAMTVLVVALFIARTKHSVRGGLWQAIAQVAVGEIRDVLDDVTRLPDDKVADLIRSRGLSKVDMNAQVDVATGEVRLVRRDTTWRGGASS